MRNLLIKYILIFLGSILLVNATGQNLHEPIIVKTINDETIKINGTKNLYVIYLWKIKVEKSINEIESLNQLAKKYEAENITFIAATSDNIDKQNEFLIETPFLYKQMASKEGKKLNKEFGNNKIMRIFPRHYILDKSGNIIKSAIGSCPTIHEIIEETLSEMK